MPMFRNGGRHRSSLIGHLHRRNLLSGLARFYQSHILYNYLIFPHYVYIAEISKSPVQTCEVFKCLIIESMHWSLVETLMLRMRSKNDSTFPPSQENFPLFRRRFKLLASCSPMPSASHLTGTNWHGAQINILNITFVIVYSNHPNS